jgi:ABC-2 type transport system ATP-binding protein
MAPNAANDQQPSSAAQSADHVLRLQSYAQLEEVLADLRAAGRVIEELELLQPDLEDVFLEIMHR